MILHPLFQINKAQAVYYTVKTRRAIWEQEGNIENTTLKWVFSTFLKCSQISGVFHHRVIRGLGFFICFVIHILSSSDSSTKRDLATVFASSSSLFLTLITYIGSCIEGKITECWLVLILLREEGKITRSRLVLRSPRDSSFNREVVFLQQWRLVSR